MAAGYGRCRRSGQVREVTGRDADGVPVGETSGTDRLQQGGDVESVQVGQVVGGRLGAEAGAQVRPKQRFPRIT